MAIFHLSLKIIGRSKGRSAVACAAYRSATRLYDQETDKVKNYTRKQGVVYTEIMLPEHAPAEFADREKLWNAVQNVETQKNAQLAREVEVALPNELPRDLQIKYLREFIQENFVDKGMVADVCIHKAMDTPKRKKKQNDHAHIMLTTRGFKANGEWAPKEKKDYARDENGNKIPEIDPKTGLQKTRVRKGKGEEKLWKRVTVEANDWNKKENAELWRKAWADTCNRALAEIQSPERVDHRSFERQGIDKLATIHEGYAAREIEARGGVSELCEYNRKVIEANGLCITYQTELAEIDAEIVSVKKQIEAEKAAQKVAAERAERERAHKEAEAKAEAERLAKEKERTPKSTLTPEQKQQIKQYYRDTNDFWPGYRQAQELATKELQAIYNSPQNRETFRELKRAQYVFKHSHGIIDKGLALIRLLFAKADYAKEQERVERVKTKREALYGLCKDAIDLSTTLKEAKLRSDLTDEIVSDILEQQELINKRLEEITNEFTADIQAQREGRRPPEFVTKLAEGKTAEYAQILMEDSRRRRAEAAEAEQRSRTYSEIIKAQAEWIRLQPAPKSPYTDRYEKDAEAIRIAIADFQRARAAERVADEALRNAGLFGKKAKREELENAHDLFRKSFSNLAKFGISDTLMGEESMTDSDFQQAIQSANALLDKAEGLAEREREKLKKESLEDRTKRSAAESRFKDLCQKVPASQCEEAEKALKEAKGNVDPALDLKLKIIYAEISNNAQGRNNTYIHH